ncbi:hypothetical protein HDE76_000254 [Rhodanobacter sp. ANJX3]|nr:hypothetical protein [Rhodanobacter sp. ANJX3]NYE27144.1 hypothetical protein [Rhodanobacter sp. K2T2]
MASELAHEEFFGVPRRAHGGRTFVYVLQCRGEDLLKVGFSHQPIVRFHALHPRFYAFFDLDESFLIETDRLKDARRIERLFIERWPEHQAPAPLAIKPTAGGHTEWFRGVGDSVFQIAQRLAERYGHPVHAPVRLWLRAQMIERADLLFAWSDRLFQIVDWQDKNQHDQARDPRYRRMLCDALDAMESVGIESKELVPEPVHQWYLSSCALRS